MTMDGNARGTIPSIYHSNGNCRRGGKLTIKVHLRTKQKKNNMITNFTKQGQYANAFIVVVLTMH